MLEQIVGPDLGYQLIEPPSDGVTGLEFLPASDNLASSSWDGVSDSSQIRDTIAALWHLGGSTPPQMLQVVYTAKSAPAA
jgi:hypothetical protein